MTHRNIPSAIHMNPNKVNFKLVQDNRMALAERKTRKVLCNYAQIKREESHMGENLCRNAVEKSSGSGLGTQMRLLCFIRAAARYWNSKSLWEFSHFLS